MSRSKTFGIPAQLKKKLNLICKKKKKGLAICQKKKTKQKQVEKERNTSHHFSPFHHFKLQKFLIAPSSISIIGLQASRASSSFLPLFKISHHFKLTG
jgi:hypothetical protein